jgi:hypothetical protein
MEHAEKEEILHAEFWWTQRSGGGFHVARLNEDEVLYVFLCFDFFFLSVSFFLEIPTLIQLYL